jgi:hypothetical protein
MGKFDGSLKIDMDMNMGTTSSNMTMGQMMVPYLKLYAYK